MVVSYDRVSVSTINIFTSVPSQTAASSAFTLPSVRVPGIPATFFDRRIFLGCESPVLSEMGDFLAVDVSYRFEQLLCIEYIHCVPKNDTGVTLYRFNLHQPISVIFGRDVAEGVCY